MDCFKTLVWTVWIILLHSFGQFGLFYYISLDSLDCFKTLVWTVWIVLLH